MVGFMLYVLGFGMFFCAVIAFVYYNGGYKYRDTEWVHRLFFYLGLSFVAAAILWQNQ